MKLCPECQRCYEDAETVCSEDKTPLAAAARGGTRLLAGKYRLEQLLGSGGIGRAYAATQMRNERSVIAIELVRDEVLEDQEALKRFHEAAKAAGRNNDQEVGQIFEYGALQDGGAYVVMELLYADNEQKEAPPTAAPTDTPTLEMKPPTGSLVGHEARRAQAPKLASIAKELTQEVPRIPLPLPPRETPASDAGTNSAAFKSIEGNQQSSSSTNGAAASTRSTTVEAQAQPPEHIADIPRTTEARRRPLSLYVGLALLLLGLILAALWYGLRRAPDASDSRGAASTATSTQGTAQSQQVTTPANTQSGSSASEANTSAPGGSGDAGATANSSEGSSQATDPRSSLSAVLDDWLSAFEKGNAERFMSFYMPELDAFYDRRKVRLAEVRPQIVRFFENTERIEARMIGEPRISFTNGERAADVRFRMSYSIEGKGRARQRGDGTQELRMVRTERGWKIESHRGEKLMG